MFNVILGVACADVIPKALYQTTSISVAFKVSLNGPINQRGGYYYQF